MRRLHLHAPDAAPALVQAEVARLGIVHQHAVAGGREQPRHGVVGGVGARVVAPGGNERRDDRAVVLLVRALGHVALHLAAALVHAVRALAEAQVALARAGAEGDARWPQPPPRRADHLDAHGHHAVGVRRQAHEQAAAVGIVGGERARPGVAPAPASSTRVAWKSPAAVRKPSEPGTWVSTARRRGRSAGWSARPGRGRRRASRPPRAAAAGGASSERHHGSECAGRGQHARHHIPAPRPSRRSEALLELDLVAQRDAVVAGRRDLRLEPLARVVHRPGRTPLSRKPRRW